MPRIVKGPDGVIHSFPDDATDQEISAALQAVPATARGNQPHTWVDTAINALPAVGGAAGGIIGGIGGTVGGLGVGGVPGAIGGAALLGGAGEAAKQLINRARGASAPSTPAQAAGDIALESGIQGGAQAVGAGIGAGMKTAAPWLMQSALKPTQAVLNEYRTTAPALVRTLLDNGINVTQNGLAKLQGLLNGTNDAIRAAVQNAPGTIEKNAVAARVLPTANKLAQQVNPTGDLKDVGNVVEQFLNNDVSPGPTLTVPEAQAMKQGTYQQIGKKYGEASSANVETQKALARGLKEEVAAKVPGIADLNAKDSQLMAALDATGRRVALSGNKDPVGFAWVAAHPSTFLAALMDRNPAVKSMLARGLYTGASAAAGVSPQMLRLAVELIASSGDETSPSPKNQ